MKILIAGDFVPQHRVTDLFAEKKYAEVLSEVKPIAEQSDFSIVNLEAPVIYGKPTPITKTGPNLSCSENAVEALRWAGFNCVTLANNHFYDQGEQGVEGTLKACKKCGMSYVGAGRNLQEAKTVLYKDIEGKILAIVNCCEHEWSIASDKHGGSNPLNPIKQYYAIQNAKKRADYVLVVVHGGIEMYQYPTPRMQETYRFFIDAGADAVVNHHQHCYSGYEIYHEKPIFYGLGNFCFDKNDGENDIWNDGYMVEISFVDDETSFNSIPYKQCTNIPTVCLCSNKDKNTFNNNIAVINNIIQDERMLIDIFKKHIDSIYERRLFALEPHANKVVNLLKKKRLLPRQIGQKSIKSMYMRVSCESNSETLVCVLKKYFKI